MVSDGADTEVASLHDMERAEMCADPSDVSDPVLAGVSDVHGALDQLRCDESEDVHELDSPCCFSAPPTRHEAVSEVYVIHHNAHTSLAHLPAVLHHPQDTREIVNCVLSTTMRVTG